MSKRKRPRRDRPRPRLAPVVDAMTPFDPACPDCHGDGVVRDPRGTLCICLRCYRAARERRKAAA